MSQSSHSPKVSVLVPVFNGERFLAECLDSILAQNFADMEILIADDQSTDGSMLLLERYAARDQRIRWWRNAHNLGLAANFNACLRVAQGDYIKYVLQDDVLLSPQVIHRMAAALDADPNVSLAGAASYVLDERSRLMEYRSHFKAGSTEGKQVIIQCLERPGNLIGEPSVVMFRRKHLAAGYDEQFRQLLDLDFWFRLLEQGDFHYVAEPLCAFRKHQAQQSMINRREGRSNEEVLLLDRWYEKPWLQVRMTRKLMFAQAHALRRQPGIEAQAWRRKLMERLGRGWYSIYLIRRRVLRPFAKLARKLRLIWHRCCARYSPHSPA